jgi:hypothetical protein
MALSHTLLPLAMVVLLGLGTQRLSSGLVFAGLAGDGLLLFERMVRRSATVKLMAE